MIQLTLPEEAWGDVDEGTEALLDRWLVAVGERVSAGQGLAEAVLVKTNFEISAPADGVLAEILVQESDTFGRGVPIGLFQADGDAASAAPSAPEPTTTSAPTPSEPVVNAPSSAPIAPVQVFPFTGIRGSVARAMSQAWQAPQVAMGLDVDMTRCLAQRDALRKANNIKLSVTPLIIKAVANALKLHPRLNAHVNEQGVELLDGVHISLAVSLDDGLVTPVIRNADSLSVLEINEQMAQLVDGARSGTLPPSAYQGGTFTVSNLGMTNVQWFTPVLNPPQAAILGVGQVAQRAVVSNDAVKVAQMLTLTLVFDHRAVDGFPAALFLGDLRSLLEEADL